MKLAATAFLWTVLSAALTAQLTVDFAASTTTGTNPVDVTFTPTISGGTPTATLWNFGDGSTSAELSPTHTFAGTGSFTVSLTVVAGFDVVTETKPDLIEVTPAMFAPAFSASITSGTNPVIVDFTDLSTGEVPTAWLWNFGDGTTSTEQNPSHVFTTPGALDVTLEVFVGTQSAALTKAGLITVDPAPLVPDFTSSSTTGVNPFIVNFEDLTSGSTPTAWQWTFESESSSTEQNPTVVFDIPGTHTVELTAFFGNQGASVSKRAFITVEPAPLEAGFIANATLGVAPLTVQFTDATQGVAPELTQWAIDFEGDAYDFSFDTNPTFTLEKPGTYDVWLTSKFGVQLDTIVVEDFITVLPEASCTEIAKIVPENGVNSVFARDDQHLVIASGEQVFAYDSNTFDLLGVVALPPADGGFIRDVDVENGVGLIGRFSVSDGSRVFLVDLNALSVVGEVAPVKSTGSFGSSVSLSQGLALIGAHSGSEVSESFAYLFDVSNVVDPVQLAKFSEGTGFGFDVDLHGDRAVVGRWLAVDGGTVSEAFLFDVSDPTSPLAIASGGSSFVPPRVFVNNDVALMRSDVGVEVFNARSGALRGSLIDPTPGAETDFADSLAVHGDSILIGAPRADHEQPSTGAVSCFDLQSLEPRQRFVASDGATSDILGAELAVAGSTLIVSAPNDDNAQGIDHGALYLFDLESQTSWASLGNGLPGAIGTPRLTGSGEIVPGCAVTIELADAASHAEAILVVGASNASTPFAGGVLVPSVDFRVSGLVTTDLGQLILTSTLPTDASLAADLYLQFWIVDPTAPEGLSSSNALRASTR